MSNTSARPLWPLHALAIPLLAALGWLIFDEKSRDFDRPTAESLAKTLTSSRDLLERNNNAELSQSEKTSMDYPSPQNSLWLRRAKRAAGLAEQARKQASDFHQAQRSPQSPPAQPATLPDMAALADSLIALTGSDSAAAVHIRTCLFDADTPVPPTWWKHILVDNKPENMEIWYANLSNKIALAEEAALRSITPKVCKAEELDFDAFEIGLAPEKTRIHPGEPFVADAYLVSYASRADNIRVLANGKELPMENGKALFNQTYSTPGQKKVKVRIEIRNPATGQVESVQKEFAVEVLPKCDSN
jgi:hypothetical protein